MVWGAARTLAKVAGEVVQQLVYVGLTGLNLLDDFMR
jgi:hypothetical protein